MGLRTIIYRCYKRRIVRKVDIYICVERCEPLSWLLDGTLLVLGNDEYSILLHDYFAISGCRSHLCCPD